MKITTLKSTSNMMMFKVVTLLLCISLSSSFTTYAVTRNFDTFWNLHKGKTKAEIQVQLNNYFGTTVKTGDLIKFSATTYNLKGARIFITKKMTLQGIATTYNPNTIGANGINTKLTEVAGIKITSNDVKFKHLNITELDKTVVLVDFRHPTYNDGDFNTTGQYKGIRFTNVHFNGGVYQVHAGDGIVGTFDHVSFFMYRNIGTWFDRKNASKSHGKFTWTSCKFSPDTRPAYYGFNDRGISFDAGNAEYPFLWNHNNSVIEKCLFINTGIGASSRGENVIIRNNIFNDNTGVVELIHVEEFSRNFTISGNVINCQSPLNNTKIIGLDKEFQRVSNITINGNIIRGDFGFFLQGYAPYGLKITNNIFEAGTSSKQITIRLDSQQTTHDGGETDYPGLPLVSENITITGNKGLSNTKSLDSKVIDVRVENAQNFLVAGVTADRYTRKISAKPLPQVPTGVYYIQNVGTGKRLRNTSTGVLDASASNQETSNAAKWKITFIPPYNYTIRNIATNQYLEARDVFNESHICYGASGSFAPFAENTYGGAPNVNPIQFFANPKPFWSLIKENGVVKKWIICPGGNERQSAMVAKTDNDVTFIPRKVDSAPNDPIICPRVLKNLDAINNKRWAWNLIRVGGGALRTNHTITSDESLENAFIFSNPVRGMLTVMKKGSNAERVSLQLISLQGEVVKELTIVTGQKNEINVNNIKAGVYLLKVANEIHKIVIQTHL